MREEPQRVYVYQPLPPRSDGKFYGLGGLHTIGLGFDLKVEGITKECAASIVRACNEDPSNAATFVAEFKQSLDEGNVFSSCGCRFENSHSNSILLCDVCSELPCHSGS
jgi:hypothetical protein